MVRLRSLACITLASTLACTSGGGGDDASAADSSGGADGSGAGTGQADDGGTSSGDAGGSDSAADGSEGGETGAPSCDATGFAQTPALWHLPSLSVDVGDPDPLDATGQSWTCSNDEALRYTAMDLTGDGVLDLVFTDLCDAGDVGDTAWLVHAGGSDGFADEPSLWHLPALDLAIGGGEPLDQLAQSWSCDNDQSLRYSTLDVTGDGIVDLVLTDRCDAADTGATAWLVYAGGADGFADEPRLWHLPDAITQLGAAIGSNDVLDQLAQTWTCGDDQALRYATMDLTGDGIVDLVVTDRCDAADTGADGWLVYPGGADGFADDPLLWHLPAVDVAVGSAEVFDQLAQSWTCDNDESFRYTLLDLDGDRSLDLVVTDLCDPASTGAEGWLVYAGGDQGFADTPTLWRLPPVGDGVDDPDVLDQPAQAWTCDNDASFAYATIDLTGDGVVDLVVTDACDTGDAGATAWLVYPGGSDGFADAPTQWALPPADSHVDDADPYDRLGQNWTCTNDASFRYVLLGLDDEPHLDLVVTDACDAGDVGATGWLVYAGRCG